MKTKLLALMIFCSFFGTTFGKATVAQADEYCDSLWSAAVQAHDTCTADDFYFYMGIYVQDCM